MKISNILILVIIMCIILAGIFLFAANIFRNIKKSTFTPETEMSPWQQSQNNTYWIIIDPISDHHSGDPFFINGTTNLPVADKIFIDVVQCHQYPGMCPPRQPDACENSIFSGDTHIFKEVDGNNTFSLLVTISDGVPREFCVRIIPYRDQDLVQNTSFNLV